MTTTFYFLLEFKTNTGVPLFLAHFEGGFAWTAKAHKACCFANKKNAQQYLAAMKLKYPEFMGYEKVEALEHGFETNGRVEF